MRERTDRIIRMEDHSERSKFEPSIKYEGFTPEQRAWVKNLVTSTGLPLDNIKLVRYTANTKEKPDTLGTYHYSDSSITLWKNLEKDYPYADSKEQVQRSTVVHETAHSFDPFIRGEVGNKIVDIYGSEEAREKTANRVMAVAEQTDKTHVFLNSYHRYNYEIMQDARMKFSINPTDENKLALAQATTIFLRETHAIMIELRFTNPKHLLQVSESQQAKLAKKGQKGIDIVDATDQTLMNVMDINSKKELNSHIVKFKTSLVASKSPLAKVA